MRRSPDATTRKQAAETLRSGSPSRRRRKEVPTDAASTDTAPVDQEHEAEISAHEDLDAE